MKLLLLVTGTTGSGKTTLVKHLGRKGFTTFHTGEFIKNSVC